MGKFIPGAIVVSALRMHGFVVALRDARDSLANVPGSAGALLLYVFLPGLWAKRLQATPGFWTLPPETAEADETK